MMTLCKGNAARQASFNGPLLLPMKRSKRSFVMSLNTCRSTVPVCQIQLI